MMALSGSSGRIKTVIVSPTAFRGEVDPTAASTYRVRPSGPGYSATAWRDVSSEAALVENPITVPLTSTVPRRLRVSDAMMSRPTPTNASPTNRKRISISPPTAAMGSILGPGQGPGQNSVLLLALIVLAKGAQEVERRGPGGGRIQDPEVRGLEDRI